MQQLERLEALVPDVILRYDPLMPDFLSGLYVDQHIYLNKNKNYYNHVGTMAEEIGHYMTSTGDITDYSNINNARQERRARRQGIRLLIPLERLIECYELGITYEYDIILHLEIDNQYLKIAIDEYKALFGIEKIFHGYRIIFDPLNIIKI